MAHTACAPLPTRYDLATRPRIAALRRGDIDGMITDIGNAFDLERRGDARILVRFNDIKDMSKLYTEAFLP